MRYEYDQHHTTVRLNDGATMPRLGLGVYQTPPGAQTTAAVGEALRLGYRHIDTAQAYGNEADVGAAIRASGLRREEVFITTKIANQNQGVESTRRSLQRSLALAQLDYFDLVLIHFPVTRSRADTWATLQVLRRDGLARSIGVSNYTRRHLEELEVAPAVNQIELSPFLSQTALRAYCAARNIVVQAYSPLTQGDKLGHPAVVAIAKHVGRSPAQVMLRWALQHELVVLPKSVTPSRIAENARVFDFALDERAMEILDGLDEDYRTCWDPTDVP